MVTRRLGPGGGLGMGRIVSVWITFYNYRSDRGHIESLHPTLLTRGTPGTYGSDVARYTNRLAVLRGRRAPRHHYEGVSMRRIHRGIGVAVAVAGLVLAAPGCTSQNGTTPATDTSSGAAKGTLTLGATLDIQGWDPAKQPGFQSWAHEAIWDSLVKCDANGKATPDVADTFEVTDNNKTFKAHIREGQKFSDGTPVDSAAVKASFEFVRDAGVNDDYKGIKISTPDAQNISITWPKPQGPIMDNKACSPKIAPAAW